MSSSVPCRHGYQRSSGRRRFHGQPGDSQPARPGGNPRLGPFHLLRVRLPWPCCARHRRRIRLTSVRRLPRRPRQRRRPRSDRAGVDGHHPALRGMNPRSALHQQHRPRTGACRPQSRPYHAELRRPVEQPARWRTSPAHAGDRRHKPVAAPSRSPRQPTVAVSSRTTARGRPKRFLKHESPAATAARSLAPRADVRASRPGLPPPGSPAVCAP